MYYTAVANTALERLGWLEKHILLQEGRYDQIKATNPQAQHIPWNKNTEQFQSFKTTRSYSVTDLLESTNIPYLL